MMTRSTNYDQADPDTGPGTVENVAGVEEEDNSVAAAGSEGGETGQGENMGPEFPGGSDDEGAGGSNGASVGSDILGPDGSVTYRTLVNLTGPDWCRVYMTAQGIRAVCAELPCTVPKSVKRKIGKSTRKSASLSTSARVPCKWGMPAMCSAVFN
jgi:hypothetical protein